ncbi:MAG: GNAT family N-acetyltransferase [Myxococcota bacterium]|nr:GNAT family N-acetyltransferase [Myxococcota bacterium]
MPNFSPGSLDELRTERLLLRRPTAADYDDMLRFHADPEVMATLGGVRGEAVTDAYLREMIAHWDSQAFGYWMAHDSETGAFAGRAGLRLMVVAGQPEIELGYGFLRDYWGRGLATEAAAAIVRVGFESVETRDLVCFTETTNDRSRRVMEKVGFRYEKDFVYADIPHRLCRLDVDRWRDGLGSSPPSAGSRQD